MSATHLARWNRGEASNDLVIYSNIDVREVDVGIGIGIGIGIGVDVALNESDVDRQLFQAVPLPESSSRENSRSRSGC